MKCPKCQFENREEVKFCEECGAKFELECPDCKAIISLGRKFCGECGYDLSKSTEAASLKKNEHDTQISESPPEKIIPTHIPAEGERKHVTVLFSDLIDRDQKSLHLLILNMIATRTNIFVPMANDLRD